MWWWVDEKIRFARKSGTQKKRVLKNKAEQLNIEIASFLCKNSSLSGLCIPNILRDKLPTVGVLLWNANRASSEARAASLGAGSRESCRGTWFGALVLSGGPLRDDRTR